MLRRYYVNFNKHSELEGTHAFLGGSNYHWLNYTPEKLKEVYINNLAKIRGTELHELAADLITHRIRLPKNKEAFNAYVNDCIGYGMTPEVTLKYSYNCYGTADAISFSRNLLRIFDLKNGKTKPSMKQLEIYMAIFCLEYDEDPAKIKNDLRIYQKDQPVLCHQADPEDIYFIMSKIRSSDDILNNLKGKNNNLEE